MKSIWDKSLKNFWISWFSRISREFSRNFTSRSRSRGIFISLFILDLDLNAFSFHFSFSKRVKGKLNSLFISRKEWKHFRFHSCSREKSVKLCMKLCILPWTFQEQFKFQNILSTVNGNVKSSCSTWDYWASKCTNLILILLKQVIWELWGTLEKS